MLPAAQYDRRVEIWRRTDTTRDAKGGQTAAPVKIATLWAARNWLNRREGLTSEQLAATNQTLFTVRYSATAAAIVATDRLRIGGVDYNVNAVQERGFREDIDIYVEGRTP